jgi:iron complex outermembrane recepter protein
MRVKTLFLCSTSTALFALWASPALAQDEPAPDSNVQAQTVPNDPAAGDLTAEEGDIVVTGLRRSLESSQNIKRNSDQIVDVVVAEDIGKLPDRTVSEALARVPGVTVERQVGEAGDVFIRGLRDPATTYNGREIFTAEVRHVAPQDFPAGGVAALEVFKSQTAELIEANLSGLINVRSRRPLDFRGFEVAGSLNGTYADQADDWAGNGNLLVTNRWAVGEGEIGALINVSYTELTYKDSIRFNSGDFFGINPDPARPGTYCDNFDRGCLGDPPPGNVPGVTVRVPAVIGLFQNAGRRWRPSGNMSLQWKPNDDLQFYVDGLYQGFRRQVSDRSMNVPMFAAPAYTNVVLGVSGSDFDYADSLTARPCCVPDGFQAATSEKTDTYQFAVGGIFENDRFRVGLDLARTDSQFDLSVYSVDYRLRDQPTINADFDGEGDGGAQFDFTGSDTTDLANYIFHGFFDRELVAKGDDYQARLDTTIKDLTPWLTGIDLGLRFSDHDAAFSNAQRFTRNGTGGPSSALPLTFRPVDWEFRDGNQPVNRLMLPTYASIRQGVGQLRALVGFPQTAPIPGAPDDETGPFDDYTANEKGYTAYAQIRYAFDGSVPIDGAIGLRAVKTNFSLDSVLNNSGVISPLSVENEYTDYLPNVSIRAQLTPKFQVRAAYTQTRQRPDFAKLSPGLRLDPPPTPGQVRTGRGGNPFLEPILSTNYDLSFEYYFARTGFAALALFRRDVSNFIVDSAAIQDIPGVGEVRVFGPVNSDKGRLQGIEAQFRTFFDFAGLPNWLEGFGTELNVTYIDNRLDAPPGFIDRSDIEFIDVSKWTYNIVGFYEQGPITARLAYNYRSRYVQNYQNNANSIEGEFTDGVSRLDGSVSFAINDNFTLAADVSNILGKPFRNYRTQGDGAVLPRDVRYEERVYSAGIRFRF